MAGVIHTYSPRRRDGHCKAIVGGRKSGYRICGLGRDAIQHARFDAAFVDVSDDAFWTTLREAVDAGDKKAT